jgi:hypothetical protein
MQPYYLHYQEAYLLRDQIPNFLRGFFNTIAAIADAQTLAFQEEIGGVGAQPHKTHEEAWFLQQLRIMLLMETGRDLYLARGTPRNWLEDGKQIGVIRAPSYFGEVSYSIRSYTNQGRIEVTVRPPRREKPESIYLRLRHPKHALLRRVTVNGHNWTFFDASKESITLPQGSDELTVIGFY